MLLGNVGGLYSILLSIAASFLSVINYGKSENYLIADLFMNKGPNQQEKNQYLSPGKQSSIKECMHQSLPKFCLKLICIR